MPEEIQEEELLGWVNGNENALQTPQQVNENIQLGFVQVQDSWPQRDSFGPYPEMLSKKSFWSGFKSGQSSKQPLPVDPFTFENFTWANASTGDSMGKASKSTPSPATFRMWAKFFSNRDPGLPSVTIPAEWMDFFTMMLLKDSSNEWATQFLKSQAWTHLSNFSSGNCYTFSLPISKPSVISELCCSDHADEQVGPSDPFQTIEGHSSDR